MNENENEQRELFPEMEKATPPEDEGFQEDLMDTEVPKSEKLKAQLEQLKVYARTMAFNPPEYCEDTAFEWARIYLTMLYTEYATVVQTERKADLNAQLLAYQQEPSNGESDIFTLE
jgi:hypothetical protein